MEMLAVNVRHPRDFRGDLAAMIGSARVGERRLLALAAEFGWTTTYAAIEAVLDGAERQTRAVIAQWKDGVYKGEAILDDDGHRYTDIPIRATVTKTGSDLIIDLSDSHEQVVGFVNSSMPNMQSAVAVALAYLIDPHTPKNDGTFRPLKVIAKEGTIVWARRRRAGDARHQPLRPGDHRGDHPGDGAGLSRPRHGRLGPPLPHRDPGPATRAATGRSSGISSRRGRAAAPRRPATAGRAAASGRRRAASSSAASK